MKKIKYFLIAAILTVISFCFSPLTASADDDIRPQKLAISGTQKKVYTGSPLQFQQNTLPRMQTMVIFTGLLLEQKE